MSERNIDNYKRVTGFGVHCQLEVSSPYVVKESAQE